MHVIYVHLSEQEIEELFEQTEITVWSDEEDNHEQEN